MAPPDPGHRLEKDKEHDDTRPAWLVRRPRELERATLLGRSQLDTAPAAKEHDSDPARPRPRGTAAPAADVALAASAGARSNATPATRACRGADPLGAGPTLCEQGAGRWSAVLVSPASATKDHLGRNWRGRCYRRRHHLCYDCAEYLRRRRQFIRPQPRVAGRLQLGTPRRPP